MFIQISGGLVSEQHRWLEYGCPGNRRPLSLPRTELTWLVVDSMCEPQTLEQLVTILVPSSLRGLEMP